MQRAARLAQWCWRAQGRARPRRHTAAGARRHARRSRRPRPAPWHSPWPASPNHCAPDELAEPSTVRPTGRPANVLATINAAPGSLAGLGSLCAWGFPPCRPGAEQAEPSPARPAPIGALRRPRASAPAPAAICAPRHRGQAPGRQGRRRGRRDRAAGGARGGCGRPGGRGDSGRRRRGYPLKMAFFRLAVGPFRAFRQQPAASPSPSPTWLSMIGNPHRVSSARRAARPGRR